MCTFVPLNTKAVSTATMQAGTPGFQVPEQLKGEGIGPHCDVYALGGVITELFGEKMLWGKISPHTIMFKVAVERTVPTTTHLSSQVETIARCCLCTQSERKTAIQLLKLILELLLDQELLIH